METLHQEAADPPSDAPAEPVRPRDGPPPGRGLVAAVCNAKGGVGKTTTVLSLADAVAATGRSVVVVDLDPQSSASLGVAGAHDLAEAVGAGRCLDALLRRRLVDRKRAEVGELVLRGASRTYDAALDPLPVSLLACSRQLLTSERQAVRALCRKGDWDHVEREFHAFVRDEVLGPLAGTFDWVIVDCPPGLGPLAAAATRDADALVVAAVPEALSIHGLEGFLAALADDEGSGLPPPRARPSILATRVEPGSAIHAACLAGLRSRAGDAYAVLDAAIPASPSLSASSMFQNLPVGYETKYAPEQRAALVALAHEIEEGAHARA